MTLLCRKLQGAKLRDECHPHTVLHHAHESFDAAQVIRPLTATSRLELTILHELITETMPFVEQPQGHFSQIAGLHRRQMCQGSVLRGIDEILFIEEGVVDKLVQSFDVCQDACVDFAIGERSFDSTGLHLRDVQFDIGIAT